MQQQPMQQQRAHLGSRQSAEWCKQHHIAWVQAKLLWGARLVLLNSCAIGIKLYDLRGAARGKTLFSVHGGGK
jgi:hypothetical protein